MQIQSDGEVKAEYICNLVLGTPPNQHMETAGNAQNVNPLIRWHPWHPC